MAEELINAVQYWRLPSPFSLWTLFKCQYHSSSCFFCYNGQQLPACLYQATRIDASSTSNFARMATDATKRKHYCKYKHFPTLSLAWHSLAWPQCKPASTLRLKMCKCTEPPEHLRSGISSRALVTFQNIEKARKQGEAIWIKRVVC